MSFPTTLSRFYITFATMTEYQNGDRPEYQNEYQKGNPNIKLVLIWALNTLLTL